MRARKHGHPMRSLHARACSCMGGPNWVVILITHSRIPTARTCELPGVPDAPASVKAGHDEQEQGQPSSPRQPCTSAQITCVIHPSFKFQIKSTWREWCTPTDGRSSILSSTIRSMPNSQIQAAAAGEHFHRCMHGRFGGQLHDCGRTSKHALAAPPACPYGRRAPPLFRVRHLVREITHAEQVPAQGARCGEAVWVR